MEPEEFIKRWRDNTRKESAASKQHFLELCQVLEVPRPGDPGYASEDYDFERSVKKAGGGKGFADVWKRDCFVWEYKGDRKSLVAAYAQAKEYASDLDNPPLLIVSDMSEIRVHTNFTNTPSVTHTIKLPDLISVEARRDLRNAFLHPERLRPVETPETVTQDAAASVGALATSLRAAGYDSRRVAHFLNKLVFCMFAEDIGLLPDYVFTEVMEQCSKKSDLFEPMVKSLFQAMKDKDGLFGTISIPWFNGGLFDDDDVLPLGFYEINDLLAASQLDWSAVEPSIFGTLFEKGLDPARRKEMASLFDARADAIETSATRDLFDSSSDKGVGIHYTDADKIMKIVEPVVLRPLRLEWEEAKEKIAALRAKKEKASSAGAKTRAENEARDVWHAFRDRLSKYRVLDPACGSGNFLYLALIHLKDFDLTVLKEGTALGLPQDNQRVTPDTVMGIEINPYAAELAQVTLWIGEIQWQLENGFGVSRRPILGSLSNIQCRDALVNPNGSETKWPKADAIIGNPPFLGGKLLISGLGEEYVGKIFSTFKGRVPAEADLVCYWFVKAGEYVRSQNTKRVGLVSTNSIRGGANRRALETATAGLVIFDAWDDEPWVIDGAAVRVSMISFSGEQDLAAKSIELDGVEVEEVYPNLTARKGLSGVDLTKARPLAQNAGYAFMGDTKGGAFDIPGELARDWLLLPLNPNGRPNSDVLKPWVNGMDVTRRHADKWIIDFGWTMSEQEAALYEAPFNHVRANVLPAREHNRREAYRKFWWRHVEPRPGMHEKLKNVDRFIATPTVAKHRLFVFLSRPTLPDHQLIVVASGQDAIIGVLHSKYHELWSLRMCSWLGVGNDPRYTPSSTFETFPFPEGVTHHFPAPNYADGPISLSVAEAVCELNQQRENWLNPSDLVEIVPEVVEGYPDRILPKNDTAAKELKKRTLTNLYNQRPAWLGNAHRKLDEAVAAAYGWPADLSDDEILKRLLELNLERAAAQEGEQS